MTLRTYGLVLILVSVFAISACGSSATTSSSVTAPSEVRCEAAVSSSSVSFGPDGGTGTISIAVARECAWRATSPVGWITFTTAVEGQGDGSVGYRVGENRDPVTRQTQLSVAERQLALSQAGAPCTYVLSGVPATIAAEGGQTVIDIETHAVCEWTAASQSSWASVSPGSGRGSGHVNVLVSANGTAARGIQLTIAGQRVEMTQREAAPPPPVPVPQPPAPSPTPPAPPAPTPVPSPPAPPAPTPPTPPTPPPTGPTPVRSIELDGEARDVAGTCPNKTFSLENRTVYTSAQTTYERGACSNLVNRVDIDFVRGMLMSDGRVRADRIRFEKDDD